MYKIINIIITINIIIVVGCVGSVIAQTKVVDYGFEDWTGDANTTKGYPFTNSAQSYWDTHTACTEVVTSYNADDMGQNWTALAGSKYLLFNRSSTTELEPIVAGIDANSVNSRSNLGVGLNYGGLNKINFAEVIITGRMFIRFWARFNRGHYGNFSGSPYPGMKFIRVHNDDPEATADIFMSLNCNHGINPLMYIWQTSSGGTHGSVTIANAYDGNWHKFSMYIDFNSGIVKQWYDVNIETLDNANQTWDNNGKIGAATYVTYISLNSNFAAKDPLDEIYSAIDNIEVWDGFPVTTDTIAPVRNKGFPAGEIGAATTVTDISLTTNENATCRYSALSGISYAEMTEFTNTTGTNHTTEVSGLENGLTYNYYVKCKDESENTNSDDFVITFSIANTQAVNNTSSGGKNCFIATAAYGTPLAEEVKILSRFRDKHLLTNYCGKTFVNMYYKYSPKMAEYISQKPGLKRVIRLMLSPLVNLIR